MISIFNRECLLPSMMSIDVNLIGGVIDTHKPRPPGPNIRYTTFSSLLFKPETGELQEEINVEKSNTKEGIAEIKAKIADVRKDKSLSKDDKLESIEELKAELEDFKQEQKDIISTYKDDIRVAKSEMKSDIKEAKKSKY